MDSEKLSGRSSLKINLLNGLCITVLTIAFCHPASAQTIDYGSLEELFGEAVTTSATGQPQRASEVPVTMKIISADDIRRSGATNIPDVLRTQSSMSVWRWTRSTADVNVRGYNQNYSPRLLVLVNGRQVYSDMYGNTLWQNIPVQLEEIRQIEIVEGPNSALFGFNAVSGVINIITYNPIYDDVSSVGVRVGTDNYKHGEFVHTQKFGDKVGIRISGGAARFDEFDEPAGVAPFFDPTQHELSLDSVIQVTENSQLRFEATKTKAKTGEYAVVYLPFNAKYDTSSAKVAYTANTGIGIIQANLYSNWSTAKSSGSGLNVVAKNKVTVAQLEDLFKIGSDHTIRLQTEYRHNALHGSLLSPGAEIYYDVYAASGMWNWAIRDDLAWTNALRFDYLDLGRTGPIIANPVVPTNEGFDQQLSEISYNSGLVWSATDKDTIRLMTARGIQAPSLIDFGTDLNFGPIVSLGNPELNAGVVTNYEFGYDRKIEGINGLFTGSLFYQETKSLKANGGLMTGLVTQPANIGDSSSVGLKLGLGGEINENWTWDTGYTIQTADDDLKLLLPLNSIPYNGADATPTHTFNAHLGYATGPWEADVYAQYVSEYKVLLNTGLSTYNSFDAGDHVRLSGRVAYKFPNDFTLALSGQELNHSDITETSGPKVERQIFLSLTKSF